MKKSTISVAKLLSYEFSRYKALLNEFAMENLEFEEESNESDEHECCEDDDCCEEDGETLILGDEEDIDNEDDEEDDEESEEPLITMSEYAFSFCALRIATYFHFIFEKIYKEHIAKDENYNFEAVVDWLIKNKHLEEKDLDNIGILLTFVFETLDIEQQETEYICYTDNEEKILLLSTDQLIDILQTAHELFKRLEGKQII
jgi:hypothetical protein